MKILTDSDEGDIKILTDSDEIAINSTGSPDW
jgi:hypothetical protein